MNKNEFSHKLKKWRRSNFIKQESLAAELGVSQVAISRWERGIDLPSPQHLAKLRSKIFKYDFLQREKIFIARQSNVRALFLVDGIKFFAHSKGFETLWPNFCSFLESNLEDHLTGEIAHLMGNSDIRSQIFNNELVMISGVSTQHVGIQVDTNIRHRWHLGFKPHGSEVIADMVYEVCPEDAPEGIEYIFRVDDLD